MPKHFQMKNCHALLKVVPMQSLFMGKRRNIGRVVNKLQFLHNGNQVVFHYTFILEDDHGQIQSPPFAARMAPAYY